MSNKKSLFFKLIVILFVFSCLTFFATHTIAWALKEVDFDSGADINYTYAGLKQGVDVNNAIPKDCVKVVFDYDKNEYENIKTQATAEIKLDVNNLGCSKGGISLYYSEDNVAYILSTKNIYATNCYSMFKSLRQEEANSAGEQWVESKLEIIEFAIL